MATGNHHRVMALSMQLLFLQGLWPDEPNIDIDSYRQYYGCWLAKPMLKHRRLRSMFRALRRAYPWSMLALWSIQLLVLIPGDTFLQSKEKLDLVENMFFMLISLFSVASLIVCLRKETWPRLLCQLEELVATAVVADEEQKKVADWLGWFTRFAMTVTPPCTYAFFICGAIVYAVMELIPNRKFYMRGWYPYDATSYPAYEITLFIHSCQFTLLPFTLSSAICTSVMSFIYVGIYFNMLCQNLQNLREISTKTVQKRIESTSRKRGPVIKQFISKRLQNVASSVESPKRIDSLDLLKPLKYLNKIEVNSLPSQYRLTALSDTRKVTRRVTKISRDDKKCRQMTKVTLPKKTRSNYPISNTILEVNDEMEVQLIRYVQIHQLLIG